MEPFFQVTSAEIWRLQLAPTVLLFCRKMFYHITWLAKVYPISTLLLIIFWSQLWHRNCHTPRASFAGTDLFFGTKKNCFQDPKELILQVPLQGKRSHGTHQTFESLENDHLQKREKECQDGWMVGGICFLIPGRVGNQSQLQVNGMFDWTQWCELLFHQWFLVAITWNRQPANVVFFMSFILRVRWNSKTVVTLPMLSSYFVQGCLIEIRKQMTSLNVKSHVLVTG